MKRRNEALKTQMLFVNSGSYSNYCCGVIFVVLAKQRDFAVCLLLLLKTLSADY